MIKYILLFVNLLGFGASYFINYGDPDTTVTGIRLNGRLPVGYTDSDQIVISSYDVYHAGNLIQYRITIYTDSQMNGIQMPSSNMYQYFVFHKDSSFGINFRDYKDFTGNPAATRIAVDSVTSRYNYTSTVFGDEKDKRPDSSFWNAGHELVNVYECKKKGQYPEDVTFLYTYSNRFMDIPETLNRKFDIAQGLKLYKIIARLHGFYYAQTKRAAQVRDCVYEITLPSTEELKIAGIHFAKYQSLVTGISQDK